jgi:carbon starvation protein
MGEETLFGRTGGAATLAVGMAMIFARLTEGRWLDLWYHFALMFEALFILTTLDAGTRVGRYLIQDAIRQVSPRLGDVRSVPANVLASFLIVAGWGWFLIKGVRDPEGGVKALWPIFGIANQLLASIALCLATTILLKMQLRPDPGAAPAPAGVRLRPAVALITLLPLAWLLAVTGTAAVQKIVHESPRIGFLAGARAADALRPALEQQVAVARAGGDAAALATAEKALRANRVTYSNNRVDAVVTGFFLVLVVAIVVLSLREWILLLARRKLAQLHETEPVWLADYAVAEARPLHLMGLIALGFTLLRELAGEAEFERAKSASVGCACQPGDPSDSGRAESRLWVRTQEERYRSVRRCC